MIGMLLDQIAQRNHLSVRGKQILQQVGSASAGADECYPRISLFKRNIDH
jgi:hypothetical protein